jgi:hypothetical protein
MAAVTNAVAAGHHPIRASFQIAELDDRVAQIPQLIDAELIWIASGDRRNRALARLLVVLR